MINIDNTYDEIDVQVASQKNTNAKKRGRLIFILSTVVFCLTLIVSIVSWLFMKDFLFNTTLTDEQRLACAVLFAIGLEFFLFSVGGSALTFLLSLISAIVNKNRKRKVFSIIFILTVCVYAYYCVHVFTTL